MRAVRSSQPTLSRGEATRARIREAANALFLRDGVEGTTVEAIAAAAGVSKPTFYLYFQRKEDLLLEYGLQRLAGRGISCPTSSPAPRFATRSTCFSTRSCVAKRGAVS
jgi:AcrR family transcriptional regulator